MRTAALRLLPLAILLGLVPPVALAQPNFDEVQIQTIPVAEGVFMLAGRGGNIGLSVGEDGAFLIDDQYAPLTDKIKAAVAAQTEQPIRFVVNTHWHGDHTGGNENMGQAGAVIVAHENVRRRMSTEQFIEAFNSRTPPAPPAALPVVTFTDAVTFHWNGDEIHVFHVDPAHTDGDAIIFFRRANVIHMGDTYFNGMYPFIDVSSGGTLAGMIAAVDRVLPMTHEDTKIIPGHGPLSNRAELMAYREMLATVHARMKALIADGKSRDEAIAARPTADLDATWGRGFLQPDVWVGIVYDAVAAEE
ncbi:MBL fold metallo-hydrolase [Rhodocaloribacter litoris]|uniref:MBL fold metallo-hydrolase n=1 Tax=Rhodocaloribacter litoris TaxID=2558931 RepID=UPI001420FAE6|nr:MBL fold metallo-hydrolase [Rhodocaloribacter litoris]QXD15548.1 MBL fold metallo-hydrolase [Rhodocaloribacter litoris]